MEICSSPDGYVIENDDLREVLTEILTYSNFEVKSLEAACDILSELSGYMPHLLILDAKLKGESGAEICKMIRAEKQFDQVKVALISLYADESSISGCSARCLTKPFSMDSLLLMINEVLESSELVTKMKYVGGQ